LLFPDDDLKQAIWRLIDPAGQPYPEAERAALIRVVDQLRSGEERGEQAESGTEDQEVADRKAG
jgi:hypothetical protein